MRENTDNTKPGVSIYDTTGHENDEWALEHLRYEACFSVHQKMKLSFFAQHLIWLKSERQ